MNLDHSVIRSYLQSSDRRDPAIFITVRNQDNFPPYGTGISWTHFAWEHRRRILTQGWGRCPYCRRQLAIRYLIERVRLQGDPDERGAIVSLRKPMDGETSVKVIVTNESWSGGMSWLILLRKQAIKVRNATLGCCVHCRRPMRVRLHVERVD